MDIAGFCRYFFEPREHEEDRAEQIEFDPYPVLTRGYAGLAKEHWDFGGRQLDAIPELTRIPDFQRLPRQRCRPRSESRQRREERRGKRKCPAFKTEADIGRAGRVPRIGQTQKGLQDHLQHVVEFWKFFERCFYYKHTSDDPFRCNANRIARTCCGQQAIVVRGLGGRRFSGAIV